ncbi:hypothetical protein B6S44_22800, partial [Bosea sp. Tri-44]
PLPVWRRGTPPALLARTVLVATGVQDRRLPMSVELHAEALRHGLVRYCPICDGFEISGRNVGVVGSNDHAIDECKFLRSYTNRLCLVLDRAGGLTPSQHKEMAAIGVLVAPGPAVAFEIEPSGISLACGAGRLCFETIYAALGSDSCSGLARDVGACLSAEGCIETDRHQRTSVKNVYAAGDVVPGLNQISSAIGQAAVAATAIRNDLAQEKLPLWG